MNKKIVLLIVLLVVSVVFLCGCNESNNNNQNDNKQEPQKTDTDGDGYSDDVDYFDDDANLHEVITIINSMGAGSHNDERWLIPPQENEHIGWDVTSDAKYVHITQSTWEIINGEDFAGSGHTPSVIIYTPTGSLTPDDISSSNRITVNSENWGNWEFRVTNNLENSVGVAVSIAVYK